MVGRGAPASADSWLTWNEIFLGNHQETSHNGGDSKPVSSGYNGTGCHAGTGDQANSHISHTVITCAEGTQDDMLRTYS